MPKKILIVDDEAFIQKLLKQALEDFTSAGVELLMAGEGEKAWEIILAEQPDLIILDLMLPGISGYDICQRVKSNPTLSSIHVIMLTARGQLVDRQRGLAVGANEYITKPFDPKQLVERIANALDITL